VGEATTFHFPVQLDCAIAGELIEHCVYPEDVIANIAKNLKPGGTLVITCPDGQFEPPELPEFMSLLDRSKRSHLVAKQFGPTSEHHLFRFDPEALARIIPNDMELIETGQVAINLYAVLAKAQKRIHRQSLGNEKTP
jgi:SAM-dependent methyltransferase